ncbi:hypothetical protein C4D60_Mb07t07320 [Musa balbisiana]|uniref:RING-type E3 ubiquitin transferase n=1 Tax=Musa balbisiana TaxID=52838 RepID=A0A4S8JDM2_MUSBA|nr:hypothetical protein C4D60_Mb07t07320 [Musa balbisiana]
MVVTPYQSSGPHWLLTQVKNRGGASSSHHSPRLGALSRDSIPFQPSPTATAAAAAVSSPSSRISPAVLFTIVILAALFFISGLLHLLVRFLLRKRPPSSSISSSPHSNAHARRRRNADLPGPGTLQRQLQQLFHLHDSGLDQAFIDALPLFLYKEILGSKEPFDCAVCLCEFAPDDKLRLLPVCGHAFHLGCIDTWLLSNSTCPLCRGAIFVQGLTIENPIYGFDDYREEDDEGFSGDQEAEADERMFSVKLGKFKKLSNGASDGAVDDGSSLGESKVSREIGETSSSNLDARRCFSMGSYQYVVSDASLQVAFTGSTMNGDGRGRRVNAMSRDESFSVSKIWQWSDKKGKFPVQALMNSDTANCKPRKRIIIEASAPPAM